VTQNFREYLVKPVIKVTLVRQRTARISILGKWYAQGFTVWIRAELIAALREAGGVTRRANLREIQVARYQPSKNAVIQKLMSILY
jgi:protein involved in polysaccharide export with SLBB domain